MPNHYDKILRENIGEVILPLSEKYFGFEIVKATDLPGKLQLTTEREPDFLKLVVADDGAEFILHLEFQTQNDAKMVYRMQTYHALLMELYGKNVRQFVLYLGSAKPRMRTELAENEIMRGFHLTSLRSIDHRQLLASEVPEEIILAILSDFKGRDPNAVIRLLLRQLLKVGEDEKAVRRAMKQLGILSRLRKLDEAITEISKEMPITYDITKDGLYNRGLAKGREEAVHNMLKAGETDLNKISRYTGVPLADVRKIAREQKKQ